MKPLSRLHNSRWMLWLLSGSLALGCAPLATDVNEPSRLPTARMSPDSVVLEVAFVTISRPSAARDEQCWQMADELKLSVEARRRLADNGFRCGLLDSQLPDVLDTLLDQTANPLQSLIDGSAAEQVSGRQQRLQSRSGRRARIVTSTAVRESLTLLVNEDGQLRGQTVAQAKCLFGLIPHPLGDGRVRLHLTPEVHHGEARPNWVGHEGAFRIDAERQREVYDKLEMELVLAPGQILVLGATPEVKGLGQHFFADASGRDVARNILLIRLAQTQFDDLFEPDRVVDPLVTPVE